MKREFYLDLAAKGVKMPIGADLVLKEKPNHQEIIYDGRKLGDVIIETAKKFKTPLAFPLMDLSVEKEWLMTILGTPEEKIESVHFNKCPSAAETDKIFDTLAKAKEAQTPRMKANCDALRHVSKKSELLPVGMAIGPFSMMTKLLDDPITPVFLAGSGIKASEDDEVKLVESSLEISLAVILKSIRLQVEAGAKAICLCEPAANKVYISPNQIEEGSDIFDRYVLTFNKRIKKLLDELGADLIFHDCGELTDSMVSKYNELDSAIMSLGCSRKLWEDARLISKNTILFGNLPTKKFYSDKDVSKEDVATLSREILEKMKLAQHPFILGSECDVLSVPGYSKTILEKLEVMLSAN
ncbi:MAG: hypothetical protein A2X49_16710 [Lentisphaerae bacterium GWF2_52_8]|nr:MAG: hypothetical protein A2X49_16710 [Lentisphaerae bacterium GWF2_52_8]